MGRIEKRTATLCEVIAAGDWINVNTAETYTAIRVGIKIEDLKEQTSSSKTQEMVGESGRKMSPPRTPPYQMGKPAYTPPKV